LARPDHANRTERKTATVAVPKTDAAGQPAKRKIMRVPDIIITMTANKEAYLFEPRTKAAGLWFQRHVGPDAERVGEALVVMRRHEAWNVIWCMKAAGLFLFAPGAECICEVCGYADGQHDIKCGLEAMERGLPPKEIQTDSDFLRACGIKPEKP